MSGSETRTDSQQTTTNNMGPELANYYRYINGLQGDIGTGRLTPMIPQGMQTNASLNPLASMGGNMMMQLMQSGIIPGAMQFGLNGASGLSQGQVASNPLSNTMNPLGGDIQAAFRRLLQGDGTGIGGPATNTYNSNFMVAGGGGGDYNPMTNADIQGTIDATNDDLARAFQRNELANIRRQAIAGGGLGGSRQGIAEGVASEGVGRAMLSNSGQMRIAQDNNERNRLSQLAMSQNQLGAAGAAAASNYQLGMANLDADRQNNAFRNLLSAAQGAGGLTGEGFGLGMNATHSGLGLMPGMLGMFNQNVIPGIQAGMDFTNFDQRNLDRDLAIFLQNGNARNQDLMLYNQLFNPAVAAQFGTQNTNATQTTRETPSTMQTIMQAAGIATMLFTGPLGGMLMGGLGAGTGAMSGLGALGTASSLFGGMGNNSLMGNGMGGAGILGFQRPYGG